MRKLFGLLVCALVFTACSSDVEVFEDKNTLRALQGEAGYETMVEFKSEQNYVTIRDLVLFGTYYFYDENGMLQMKNGPEQSRLGFRLYSQGEKDASGHFIIRMYRNASEWPSFIQMDCGNNKLTSLNFFNCENVQALYCDNNLLTSIDLSSFAEKLASFDCSQNQIRYLNLSNCTKLEGISCSNNPISSLDVSACERLNDLAFSNTQISAVNLGRANVRIVYCHNTPLVSYYSFYRDFIYSLPSKSSAEVGYFSPYPNAYPDLVEVLKRNNWVKE